jgi:hypothetical protein
LAIHQRREAAGRWTFTAPLYFSGLGLGFIMVEISIIQQTRLILGHPTMATTVVLATLLISGGIGSGLAGRWFQDKKSFVIRPLLLVILFLTLWLLLWPWVQSQALSAQPNLRILLVVTSLLPLGLVMGMPFPLGLQVVASWGKQQVALAWTINGIMSVVGSVLAVALAIQLGFSTVLLVGGIAYGLATIAASFGPGLNIDTLDGLESLLKKS